MLFLALLGTLGAAAAVPATAPTIKRLPKVGILPTAPCELYTVEVGAKVLTESDAKIESLAPEIRGLNGVRIPSRNARVELDSRAPVQLLVGIFRGQAGEYQPAPAKGPAIQHAATITGLPPLDVYLVDFERGKRVLTFPGTCVILGVIPAGVVIEPHDAKGGTR
jgi:hypothetical protein